MQSSAQIETHKVLIVDDDRPLVELLDFALRRAGFAVIAAYDAEDAMALLGKRPDIAVVDINLGRRDGFELLSDIRRSSQFPVIMLTARDSEDDTVRALELGADDYITKPFSYRELVARIEAHLRRASLGWAPPHPENAVLEVGPIRLDMAAHEVWLEDQPLDVTVTEFRLLRYLMLNAGTAVPTASIIQQVWGYNDPNAGQVVRVAVHRLRRKLKDSPLDPQLLHTVAGVGFMLRASNH